MLAEIMKLIEKGYGYVEDTIWGVCPVEYGEEAKFSIECGLEDDESSVEWKIDDEQKIIYGYWSGEDY